MQIMLINWKLQALVAKNNSILVDGESISTMNNVFLETDVGNARAIRVLSISWSRIVTASSVALPVLRPTK